MLTFDEFKTVNIRSKLSGAARIDILSNTLFCISEFCSTSISKYYVPIRDIVDAVVAGRYYISNVNAFKNLKWAPSNGKRSTYLIIEDTGAGEQFWSAICVALGWHLFDDYDTNANGNPCKGCKSLEKLCNRLGSTNADYVILLDTPVGSPALEKDVQNLRIKASQFSNIVVLSNYNSFEYAFLSFAYFVEWTKLFNTVAPVNEELREAYLNLGCRDTVKHSELIDFIEELNRLFNRRKDKANNFEQAGKLILRLFTCCGENYDEINDFISVKGNKLGKCWLYDCSSCNQCTKLNFTALLKARMFYDSSCIHDILKEVRNDADVI